MMTAEIAGIIVPILTPVDLNEKIDEKKLRFMIDHVIQDGVHGILLFGSNGEFFMFSQEEMIQATKITLDQVKGRVPVYFGLGEIRTSTCIELAKKVAALGVAGISILQPMFIQPNDDELYDHFRSIAEAVPQTPTLLYNNPGRTGYTMSGNLVERLAKDVLNIVGMKDSSGDLTQLMEFIRRTKGLPFSVLAGKDTIIYPALSVGATGAVCSTANMFGKLVSGIYDKFQAGEYEAALEDQYRLNPVRLSQDKATFPAATKDMANLMNLDVGFSVKPIQTSKASLLGTMEEVMRDADLL